MGEITTNVMLGGEALLGLEMPSTRSRCALNFEPWLRLSARQVANNCEILVPAVDTNPRSW